MLLLFIPLDDSLWLLFYFIARLAGNNDFDTNNGKSSDIVIHI